MKKDAQKQEKTKASQKIVYITFLLIFSRFSDNTKVPGIVSPPTLFPFSLYGMVKYNNAK